MIRDDDNSSLLEAPLTSVVLAETLEHTFLLKATNSPETQNSTNTHLYHIVHAKIFKGKLQAAKHCVSSNSCLLM